MEQNTETNKARDSSKSALNNLVSLRVSSRLRNSVDRIAVWHGEQARSNKTRVEEKKMHWRAEADLRKVLDLLTAS